MRLTTTIAILGAVGLLGVLLLAARHASLNGPLAQLTSDAMTTTQQPGTPRYSKSGHDITPLSQERIEELARDLTEEERTILLKKGTEPAFCGNLLDNKTEGMYACNLCDLPLFASDAKFTSGTGWPSFFKPVDPDHIAYERDTAFGMVRTEILCARCGGHLGHVFEDGPKPTGLRYCLNSASLQFYAKGDDLPEAAKPIETSVAYFAGGCFWGVEHHLQQTPGVISVVSGYQNGNTENPTYREICTGTTGHAESVKVVFDPATVTYRELLERFFWIHDPRQLNRQGPDVGTQYRSAVFAADAKQLEEAKAFVKEIEGQARFKGQPIVTQIEMADTFWPAEEYHQDYHDKNGGYCPLPPWAR